MDAFPIFPFLPAEIRAKIWRAALGPGTRTIWVKIETFRNLSGEAAVDEEGEEDEGDHQWEEAKEECNEVASGSGVNFDSGPSLATKPPTCPCHHPPSEQQQRTYQPRRLVKHRASPAILAGFFRAWYPGATCGISPADSAPTVDAVGLACREARREVLRCFPSKLRLWFADQSRSLRDRFAAGTRRSRLVPWSPAIDVIVACGHFDQVAYGPPSGSRAGGAKNKPQKLKGELWQRRRPRGGAHAMGDGYYHTVMPASEGRGTASDAPQRASSKSTRHASATHQLKIPSSYVSFPSSSTPSSSSFSSSSSSPSLTHNDPLFPWEHQEWPRAAEFRASFAAVRRVAVRAHSCECGFGVPNLRERRRQQLQLQQRRRWRRQQLPPPAFGGSFPLPSHPPAPLLLRPRDPDGFCPEGVCSLLGNMPALEAVFVYEARFSRLPDDQPATEAAATTAAIAETGTPSGQPAAIGYPLPLSQASSTASSASTIRDSSLAIANPATHGPIYERPWELTTGTMERVRDFPFDTTSVLGSSSLMGRDDYEHDDDDNALAQDDVDAYSLIPGSQEYQGEEIMMPGPLMAVSRSGGEDGEDRRSIETLRAQFLSLTTATEKALSSLSVRK